MPLPFTAVTNALSTASARAAGGATAAARPSREISRARRAKGALRGRGERTWPIVIAGTSRESMRWRAKPLILRSSHVTTPRSPGRGSALAGRAPIPHPLSGGVVFDAGAAATARLPGSPVDPQLPARPRVAGGAAAPAQTVGPQHLPGAGDQPGRVGHRADRRAR